MMEALRTSETSVHFNVTTRRYIPQDSKLQVVLPCGRVLLLLEFTEWYRTRRPIDCDYYSSSALFHLSSNHSWLTQTELSGSNQQKRLVAKQVKLGEKCQLILPTTSLFHTEGIFNMPKNLTKWDRRLYPPKKDMICIFIALKIHRSLPGMNSQTLGTIASTVTNRPPRATLRQ
jgi:hypothetical protein